jgi:hypothetical protein
MIREIGLRQARGHAQLSQGRMPFDSRIEAGDGLLVAPSSCHSIVTLMPVVNDKADKHCTSEIIPHDLTGYSSSDLACAPMKLVNWTGT